VRRFALTVVAPLLLAGCAVQLPVATRPTSRSPGTAATPAPAELEREIHLQVNQYRARRGLPPLAFDERIDALARSHSAAMAAGERSFGHDGFQARTEAVARLLPTARAFAENVSYDSRTGPRLAQLVVEGWIDSPEHRANLEGPYDLTGIGVAIGRDGRRYFTQLFVGSGE
jgi:uncharacterized protein YkwD